MCDSAALCDFDRRIHTSESHKASISHVIWLAERFRLGRGSGVADVVTVPLESAEHAWRGIDAITKYAPDRETTGRYEMNTRVGRAGLRSWAAVSAIRMVRRAMRTAASVVTSSATTKTAASIRADGAMAMPAPMPLA
jgi:hypothetical protein